MQKQDYVDQFKEDYLCEADGSCGTMIRGRGIEYQSKKERWLEENRLLKIELKKKDSLINLENFKELPIAFIEANANQPREYFDEDALLELAESIKRLAR